MKKICISKDWKFKSKNTDYVNIDLPHDYQIKQKRDPGGTGSNGFFPDNVGRYVKYLTLDKKRHYVLDIDGAYMCAHIIFNEHTLAMHPNGYTPFLVDLTPYMFDGITNKLIITTAPIENSTRWYSGNGIYRDVFLWEGGDHRIEPWDIFISTVNASEDSATIKIKYTVTSDYDADLAVKFEVRSGDNTVCAKTIQKSVVSGKNEGELLMNVSKPLLWDTESPALYTMHTEIERCSETVDTTDTTFGIRTVTADVKNGLLLNGKQIKLRGGCIHHDHGELGAAAFPAAEERKIRKLKAAGFNAIRCTHNPSSLALLEACDRLGMIAMDEAFDVWNVQKRQFDYHIFFRDWWARDISYMVLRDRNHPCIFSYSIGNEVLEVNGMSDGASWAKKLADEVRKYDNTRFVTFGEQKVFARRFGALEDSDPEDYRKYFTARFATLRDPKETNLVTGGLEAPLDIVGVNYYYDRYNVDHEMYPDRVLWGSETKAIKFYHSWRAAENNSFVLGDFTWTAFDNMGEAGAGRMSWVSAEENADGKPLMLDGSAYPWRNCYQGDFDLCGFRRPQSYFREAIWKKNTEPRIFVTHPKHFGKICIGTGWHWYDVDESWTYDDEYVGRPITVETYTVAEKVMWYINGRSVGESLTENGIARLDTVYEKGNIRAVAYEGGSPVSEFTLYTAGQLEKISLCPENTSLAADGRDLSFLDISLTDKDGHLITSDDRELACYVEGGELMAFFSGDPMSCDFADDNLCHSFKGRALAIVRAKAAGEVTITVSAEGIEESSISIAATDE